MELTFSELIDTIQERQVAKAKFVNTEWHVAKSAGFIRYFDEGVAGETVKLTPSNIRAYYTILKEG